MLCRRTFATFLESDHQMSGADLCIFVQASLALQENFFEDIETLPCLVRNVLIRDLKMAYCVRLQIQHAITNYPDSITAAIEKTWPSTSSSDGKSYSSWSFLKPPRDGWITSTVRRPSSHSRVAQTVHYNSSRDRFS